MNQEALRQMARRIAGEAFAVWEEHERKGIADAVPHLESALQTLARCGVSPDPLPFPDWLCHRAARAWPPRRRGAAVRAMGFIGSASHRKVVGGLLRRLRSRNWQTKRDVLIALRRLEVSSHEEGLFLGVAQELKNRQMAVRVAAAHLLIFWERREGKQSLQLRITSPGKGSKNTAYLLDLARDLARAQERQATDAPPVAFGGDPAFLPRPEHQKQEVERLLESLVSLRIADRQRVARLLGERMQAGCRIFERQGRLVILLPSDSLPSEIQRR